MEKQFTDIKAHYCFAKSDEELLFQMRPELESHADEFLEGFYEFIWKFGQVAEFLTDEVVIARHRGMIRQWYLDLFGGTFDISYFMKLYKIGEVHVRLGLPTHYVNAAFNYVRIFAIGEIQKHYHEDPGMLDRVKAVEKIIDINLDVLTASYREEEMSHFLGLSRVEKTLLSGLKNISSYFNYLLSGALVLVAFFAVGLFGYDVYLLFSGQIHIEKGILTVLGSLLILWAAIELIHEEMKHLRGGSFAVEVFITLAIAALIRKILIFSLSPEKTTDVLMYGGLVLCLSLSYWVMMQRNTRTKK